MVGGRRGRGGFWAFIFPIESRGLVSFSNRYCVYAASVWVLGGAGGRGLWVGGGCGGMGFLSED